MTGQQEATAVGRHWREIEALLLAGYQEVIEAYLVTEKAAAGSEQEARPILHDFTGELHQRYEAEQDGLPLIRPDGYIGFLGPVGAIEALHAYVQELFSQVG